MLIWSRYSSQTGRAFTPELASDTRQVFRRNARAGVLDDEADVIAGSGPRYLSRLGLRDGDDGSIDEQPSAFGHGIAGVDGEVQENLFHHARVGMNHRQAGRVIDL